MPSPLPPVPFHRQAALNRLEADRQPFDFIIVGGGATGLGAAVEAASRGHRTLLIEQADFASGTSSRSTKLVHGGVRYLRQGNIGLVVEALRERGLLSRNAPHLVRSMAFLIPNFQWWEGPFYGIGLKVYDNLAGRLGLGPSRWLSREETLARLPNIEQDGLQGGVVYHDGQFDDARLAINLAQTAAEQGAITLNYVRCAGLLKEHGSVKGVLARCLETGREWEIRGRAVINATGVGADDVRRMDDPSASALVTVSQGIHLVLPASFLPGQTALMVPKTADGRVLFAVPWHGRVVVGTTDTPLPDRWAEPRALAAEREFVLSHASHYLAHDPAPGDVLSVFAGLRPLVRADDTRGTAALSRDHAILIGESGLITVIGGKWTTYRKMGEDILDQAEMVAGVDNRPSVTRDLPIHGACPPTGDFPGGLYGADAPQIATLIREHPELGQPLHSSLPYCQAHVVWASRHEMARTVEDVLARRTRCLVLEARASRIAASLTAQLLAAELGRDADWAARQAGDFVNLANGYDFLHPASTRPHPPV